MIVDFDDFHEGNHRMDLLHRLKAANGRFKATLFTVPGLYPPHWLRKLPSWLEIAGHGWFHPDPYEAAEWSYARADTVLMALEGMKPFVKGWKSPGWQISDGTYQALLERGWWVADKDYNNGRRPAGLRHHLDGESIDGLEHWHGHIQNVCGNGLEETFPELLEKVTAATEFRFISEVVHL